jgi:formate hydrogenlyase subunit 3/multisubunit Na+/H+ antiporter MnhD subunit
MSFGFLILRSYHAQDKRLLSLFNLNPLIKRIYYFSCLCLAGLPFLRGFFSKDLIIEKVIRESIELSFLFLLLLFLRIRIFYSIKLIILGKVFFSYIILEKNYVSILSLSFIILLIRFIINVYLRLVFRVTLELFSFKIFIYLIIFFFFILSFFFNLNFKLTLYDFLKNFKEI